MPVSATALHALEYHLTRFQSALFSCILLSMLRPQRRSANATDELPYSAFYPSYISVVNLLQSLHFGGALNAKKRYVYYHFSIRMTAQFMFL